MDLLILEARQTSIKNNIKKVPLGYTILKTPKIENKEEILKEVRGKQHITLRRTTIVMTADIIRNT